jgi:hypothetical protein
MMKNLYFYLALDSLKTVYFTHFQSQLQFGIILWGSITNLHNTLIMQMGLRQRTSCTEKFKKLQILTVPQYPGNYYV